MALNGDEPRKHDLLHLDSERRRLAAIGAYHGIIGQSEAILPVYSKIDLYGPAEAPVLITGETGTGKELVARAIHARSRRRLHPYVAFNCCALNEDLFESELFGHEKGAFTGANRTHKGRFERADGGTLFLDEIGDMSMRVQAKMLRALEEGVIERVGAEEERRVDVRVVAATNMSLENAVQTRRFRGDLYHRIAVFRIHVPPLRERQGDIPLLVNHVLSSLNRRYGRKVERLTPEALRLLEGYSWPGNVRELHNVLERVYIESRAGVIGRNAFAEWERERDSVAAGGWDVQLLEQQRLAGRPIIIVPSAMPLLSAGSSGVVIAPEMQSEAAGQTPAVGPDSAALHPLAPVIPFPVATFGLGQPAGPGDLGRRDVSQGPIDVSYAVERPAEPPREELTEAALREAFARAQGNLTRAARLLRCHKTTLYRNMKRLGLSRQDLERGEN